MKIEAIRAADGTIYQIQRSVGYTDLYTTLVFRSGVWNEIRGFTYALGYDIPGASPLVATRADTNLNVSGEWGRAQEWLGLEWGMPLSVPARFQEDPNGGDYPVTPADIIEFVNKAFLRLFCGDGDRPFVEVPLSSVDVQRSELRIYQQIVFREPLRYIPKSRLWLAIDWPAGASGPPTFGKHPTTGRPGVLAIIVKLMEQLPPIKREESPAVDLTDMVRVIQDQARQISTMYSSIIGTTTAGLSAAAATAQPRLNQSNMTAPVPATDAEALVDEVRFRGLQGSESLPGAGGQRNRNKEEGS